VVLVLLVASINEQLNLGYALSFLLGGAGLAALYQTHGNLQGLRLRMASVPSTHAGDMLHVHIHVHNPHRRLGRHGLSLRADEGADIALSLDLSADEETQAVLSLPATTRGLKPLPRLTLETRYPLGLFRAWAHWRPAALALVWPAVAPDAPPLPASTEPGDTQGRAAHSPPGEHLDGLRDHRRGDPLRWVAWRKSSHTMLANGALVGRSPEPPAGSQPIWLDLERSEGLQRQALETRLSWLATWLLAAETRAQRGGPPYGLRLPGQASECGQGAKHLRHCLDRLATWEQRDGGMAA
jgi:uncharacterized protein (DUF58 family)